MVCAKKCNRLDRHGVIVLLLSAQLFVALSACTTIRTPSPFSQELAAAPSGGVDRNTSGALDRKASPSKPAAAVSAPVESRGAASLVGVSPLAPGAHTLSPFTPQNLPVPGLPDLADESMVLSIPEPPMSGLAVPASSPAAQPIEQLNVALTSAVGRSGAIGPFSGSPLSQADSSPAPAVPSPPSVAMEPPSVTKSAPPKAGGQSPKTTSAPSSVPSHQTTPTLASAPAAVAGKPAVAGASSGNVAGAAPPVEPSNPPAARLPAEPKARTVYARVGDDITIALDGAGWTFTGGGSGGDGWKGGMEYESRSTGGSGTTFIFRAKGLGQWPLEFQQQISSTGSTNAARFSIHVLTDQEFARFLARGGAANDTGSSQAGANSGAGNQDASSTGNGIGPAGAGGGTGGGLAAADWLFKEGEYRKALDAYEQAWQPNDPGLTDKIAELAYRVGRYKDAREYWQKNFNLSGTEYAALAVAGLMKTATAQKDAPELRALFDSVHSLHNIPMRGALLSAAQFLYDSREWGVALRYLDEYLKRYNGQVGTDAVEYLLGEIYQGPLQNAQKALAYYQDIVAHYPTSDYYERARSNINYLNRHFFEIR